MLFLKEKDFFGLDIDFHFVRVVQIKKEGRRAVISSFGESISQEELLSEEGILDKNLLASKIKEALEKAKPTKINTQKFIAGINDKFTFTKTFILPAESLAGDFEATVKWEMKEAFSIVTDNFYFDWNILEMDKNNIRVFVAAVPKTFVDDLLEILQNLKLKPLALEIDPVAIIRSLIKVQEKDIATLIFDIGSKNTSVILYDKNQIVLIGSALIGTDQLKNDFQKGNINLDEIIKEAKSATTFLKEEHNKTVKRGIICGEGVLIPQVKKILTSNLKIPIKIGDPTVNLSNEIPIPLQRLPLFITAIGLALREK